MVRQKVFQYSQWFVTLIRLVHRPDRRVHRSAQAAVCLASECFTLVLLFDSPQAIAQKLSLVFDQRNRFSVESVGNLDVSNQIRIPQQKIGVPS